jgi:HTH-type transcriptional regulator/antitoxin HipB
MKGSLRLRTPTDLGALIRDRRRALGLDQRALAARAQVSRQWILSVERGKPGASVGLILRTLDALGVVLSAGAAAPPTSHRGGVDIDAIVAAARRRRR